MAPHATSSKHLQKWWKEATFYQIYPASFSDANGDGLGDLPGILSKIPYLASLGIDVVWISPMFDSPQKDMGYDISNYEAVYPPYGSVKDMENLIAACHENGMKIILDLVVNHTSDQHAWFKESRSSKSSSKRDWYFWKPARYSASGERLPPTNWRSYFNGGTWTWDEVTQEYYLHLYDPSQPDLNWENEDCRRAIYDSAMRFWLDKGIDGFRVDTVNKYSKHTSFLDAPVTDPNSYFQPAADNWCNGPRIHEFVREMNEEVLSKYKTFDGQPVVTVGELSLTPEPEGVLRYVSAKQKELDMVFQFDITHLGQGGGFGGKYDFVPWTLPELKKVVAKWQIFIDDTDGWTTVFNENHDNGRCISRYADHSPEWREKSAKMLALWLGCCSGTLFLYQGQEIGMINAPDDWDIEKEYKDVESISHFRESDQLDESGADPGRKERITRGLQLMARDHSRLPFQWDGSANGGFSTGTPWMRAHDLYPEINAEKQAKDPTSVLSFYKRLLSLRKAHQNVFVYGAFELLDPENVSTFVFKKHYEDKTALVALNFTSKPQPGPWSDGMTLLVSSYSKEDRKMLQPYEGRVYINYE